MLFQSNGYRLSRLMCIVELSIVCIAKVSPWRYSSSDGSQSSVTILAGSLKHNHTYQFVVNMTNLRNLTFQGTGYLLVKVENTRPQVVVVT